MKKGDPPIIVEQDFGRSVSEVWKAITEPDEMRQWYFENLPDYRAEVGFSTEFPVRSGERTFLHQWVITEVEPKRKLVCNWRFKGIPGDSSVVFEVSGDDRSARLAVSTLVHEDFPEDIPEFRRESCIGGWTWFIKDRLKSYLDG
ncbi:MAG: SRPBCC domain-containing protein [Acidobacteriota bacterium]|nr:MAG: SRPBCC domain-containing protein [Acidobacteriota bacterium]